MTAATKRSLYNPTFATVLRIVVGAVFVVSGFVKAIDPWGLVFKMEDYLGVWGIDMPRTVVVVGAIAMSAYEFVAGVMLAMGCFRRMAPWLLMLLMAFLLPLTFYTWVASPVDDCGCFGDFIKLSNPATFWKNVVFTTALAYLCAYNRLTAARLHHSVQWLALICTSAYILAVSVIGYNIQPMIDFRPYPVGTDMGALFAGDDADTDDAVKLIYEKEGVQREFDIYDLPDSTWTFVDRVEPASQSHVTRGFAIYDGDDEVTPYVIDRDAPQLLLIVPDFKRIDIAHSYTINELDKAIADKGGSLTAIMGAGESNIDRWRDLTMAEYPCYTAEDTSLKELARGDMSIVCLEDGVVSWKRALGSFTFDEVERLGHGEITFADLRFDGAATLRILTIIYISLLGFIVIMQQLIARCFRKRKKQRNFAAENVGNPAKAASTGSARPSDTTANK